MKKYIFWTKVFLLDLAIKLLGYRFIIATKEEDRNEVFRIRYQVYSEKTFIDPKAHPTGLFRDTYDLFAVNILARKAGRPVGCLRLIPRKSILPTEKLFNLDRNFLKLLEAESDHFIELSRLVVSKEFRRKSKNHGRLVMFGLALTAFRYSEENGIKFWLMNLPEHLAGSYAQMKAELKKIPELEPTAANIEARKTIAGYFAKHTLYPYFLKLDSLPS